jgi:glycosyltransferase involved in cell wall biosynthesis
VFFDQPDSVHILKENNATTIDSRSAGVPFFSVCIPQHNRTEYLLYALERLGEQTYRDFEICISDDCSTDGQLPAIYARLTTMNLDYVLLKRATNGRYDANLRSAISLARGRYAVLIGNDDCLAGPSTLEALRVEITKYEDVGVVITNYADFDTRKLVRRVFATRLVPGGPHTACRIFRNFSFVSGIVLKTDLAQSLSTDRYDGSEMYQMYIGLRIIASGHNLLEIQDGSTLKDIRIRGAKAAPPPIRQTPVRLEPKVIPILARFGKTAYDGIAPYSTQKSSTAMSIFRQLYVFTFPYFMFEFRSNHCWKYAMNVCMGLRPAATLSDMQVSGYHLWAIRALYLLFSSLALVLPVRTFTTAQAYLHRFAKRMTRVSHAQESP